MSFVCFTKNEHPITKMYAKVNENIMKKHKEYHNTTIYIIQKAGDILMFAEFSHLHFLI